MKNCTSLWNGFLTTTDGLWNRNSLVASEREISILYLLFPPQLIGPWRTWQWSGREGGFTWIYVQHVILRAVRFTCYTSIYEHLVPIHAPHCCFITRLSMCQSKGKIARHEQKNLSTLFFAINDHNIHWFQAMIIPAVLNINTLRPRQNGRHFADDIFKCIFLNENVWIPIKISLKFVPQGPINNIPALVQIMAWRRPGGKPLSEPMMVSLLTHICVTRPQCVKKAHFYCH